MLHHGSLAAFALGCTGLASAQEWPRFRGPNGSGTSATTGLASSFGREENLRWRTALPAGHSSPVLGEESVFLTGADAQGLVVVCLARDTGAVRWERRLERARTHEIYAANGAATPSPTIDAENVYAFFPELGLVSFDAAGAERWRLPLGPFVSFYGLAASPILAGNTLVLPCDQQRGSFLIGVDAANGAVRWRTEREGESWTTPVLVPARGAPEIVVFGSYFVCAYALESGAELWRRGGLGFAPVCSPILWERAAPEAPVLFTSVHFQAVEPLPAFELLTQSHDADADGKLSPSELPGSMIAEHFGWADASKDGLIEAAEWDFVRDGMSSKKFGLVAFGLGDGRPSELWRCKRGLPAVATPLLVDGVLYLIRSGGMLTTLDAASGRELSSLRLEGAPGDYEASPVAADGKVFLASTDGRISVLSAGAEPELLHHCDLGEPIHATPALGKGALFVRTDAALYCFASAAK